MEGARERSEEREEGGRKELKKMKKLPGDDRAREQGTNEGAGQWEGSRGRMKEGRNGEDMKARE